MEKEEILLNVQNIFCDVLDNEDIQLTEQTTADDVDDWDVLKFEGLLYRKKEAVIYDEVNSERIHFNFEDKKTKLTREYFEKAKEILKCWTGIDKFDVLVTDKQDQPLILFTNLTNLLK